MIERGDEHQLRINAVLERAPRDLEAGDPRHLHVEHDEVRLFFPDHAQRLDPVGGLSDDLYAAHLLEQEAQLLPCQLLIVHDNCSERGRRHVRR